MTHLQMVYLLKMVIFHGYVSHNQMVLSHFLHLDFFPFRRSDRLLTNESRWVDESLVAGEDESNKISLFT